MSQSDRRMSLNDRSPSFTNQYANPNDSKGEDYVTVNGTFITLTIEEIIETQLEDEKIQRVKDSEGAIYYLKQAPDWRLVNETLALGIDSWFKREKPSAILIKNYKTGTLSLLVKEETDDRNYFPSTEYETVKAAIDKKKLHGLVALATRMLFFCNINFSRTHLVRYQNRVIAIQASLCFASSFMEEDPSNPANVFFRKMMQDRSTRIISDDLESLPNLSSRGYYPLNWLWELMDSLFFEINEELENTGFLSEETCRTLLELLIMLPRSHASIIQQIYEEQIAPIFSAEKKEAFQKNNVDRIIAGQTKRHSELSTAAALCKGFANYVERESKNDFNSFCQYVAPASALGSNVSSLERDQIIADLTAGYENLKEIIRIEQQVSVNVLPPAEQKLNIPDEKPVAATIANIALPPRPPLPQEQLVPQPRSGLRECLATLFSCCPRRCPSDCIKPNRTPIQPYP